MRSRKAELAGKALMFLLACLIKILRASVFVFRTLTQKNARAGYLKKLRRDESPRLALGSRKAAILIPVFNNWKWTKRCIHSLHALDEIDGVDLWVLDDYSSDGTSERLAKLFPKVHVIRNQENLGFLRSCNSAFRTLRKDYDLFFLLNNDTEALPGFFSQALACLDSNPEIAMVGSRLLYPNGNLQEAGGLIWRSGNAWNFGRGDNPRKPEYSIDREVDYASGAALLIKTMALTEVDYFSPEFAPAYCEDSDLAFKLRAIGYQVWLSAKSNVIHFEGKSNGTSLSKGVKSYQKTNQVRLQEKWSSELKLHFDEARHTGTEAAFRLSPSRLPTKTVSADPLESLVFYFQGKLATGSPISRKLASLALRLKDFYLANSELGGSQKRLKKLKHFTSSVAGNFDTLYLEKRGDPNFDPSSNLIVFISRNCAPQDHLARAYQGLLVGLGGKPVREVRILNNRPNNPISPNISLNPNVKIISLLKGKSETESLNSQLEELKDYAVLHLDCCTLLSESFLSEAENACKEHSADYVVGKAILDASIIGEAGLQEINTKVVNPAAGARRNDIRFDLGRIVSRLGASPWLKKAGTSSTLGAELNIWFQPSMVSYFQATPKSLIPKTKENSRQQGSLDWLLGAKRAGTILVIEDQIPMPDRHAGDVTVSQYLELFLNEGFSIVFWPRHSSEWSSYRQALLDKGILVLESDTHPETWLSTFGCDIDSVWVARPHNGNRLIPLIRKYSAAKIVYYTHDLHFLREEREGFTFAGKENHERALKTKAIEVGVFESVDIVASPSEAEAQIIKELAPSADVITIPPYFIEPNQRAVKTGKARQLEKSILFVGGFPHTPNVDAALVLALEVMPIVWQKVPSAKLYLVGYSPPPQVLALQGDRIEVTGQVPTLEPYLANADVFCAPLNFGAGVKGKVVDALKFGLPIVGTNIAFEGIDLVDGRDCIVGDSAASIAKEIIQILSDEKLAQTIGQNGQKAATLQFSREIGLQRIRAMNLGKGNQSAN